MYWLKKVIVYQTIKNKNKRKIFRAKEIKYFTDYVVIVEKSWREQVFKNYNNLVVDSDDFSDLKLKKTCNNPKNK